MIVTSTRHRLVQHNTYPKAAALAPTPHVTFQAKADRVCIYLAVVTLTPLETPDDFTRVIVLSSIKNTISVGRASKNETKGLRAERDNAWFDSPIMSRQHAVLSMSSLPKVSPDSMRSWHQHSSLTNEQRISLEDCGSTHGTFISGLRLQPNEPRALKDWDVIRFGTKITSGTGSFSNMPFANVYTRQLT